MNPKVTVEPNENGTWTWKVVVLGTRFDFGTAATKIEAEKAAAEAAKPDYRDKLNKIYLSSQKHTPGPWQYAGNDAQGCDVYRDGPAPHERGKIADVMREADAKLIAAAPDLLKCCELAIASLMAAQRTSDTIVRGAILHDISLIRNAVAKATGGTCE